MSTAARENPAWRAYALMVWQQLETWGRRTAVVDEKGEPVPEEDGKPKTEWKSLTLEERRRDAIREADLLYAAEIEAEARRVASAEQPGNGDDADQD